jgi:hypothetical protein
MRAFHIRIIVGITIMISIYSISSAQIKTGYSPKTVEHIAQYDSTANFLIIQDATQYIGQTVYVLGLPKSRNYIYEGFYRQVSDLNSIGDYNSFRGRYFKVVDVLPSVNYGDYYLKLVSEDLNHDTIYKRYNILHKYLFPFIVRGYFEKLKLKYLNKKVVPYSDGKAWQVNDIYIDTVEYDINFLLTNKLGTKLFKIYEANEPIYLTLENSGKISTLDPTAFKSNKGIAIRKTFLSNSKILCITDSGEITLLNYKHYPLAKVAYNDYVGYVNVSAFKNCLGFDKADKTQKQIQKLILKYGEDIGLGYFYKIPCLGMKSTMVYEIMGQPKHINTTSTRYSNHEQWVYENGIKTEYYYFDNGILTTIQN